MRIAALILAAGLAITLGGCVKDDGPIVPKPLPSSTPIFASDEEALAAAEEAYGEYLGVLDEIFYDGGAKPDRLATVATDKLVQLQSDGFSRTAQKGWHSVGSTAFDSAILQSYTSNPGEGDPLISMYLCVDVSGLDVLDADGSSVVSPDRPARSPFQVTLEVRDSASPDLLVSGDEPWTGSDFCSS